MSEIKTNKITSLASNNDITIDPDGTGDVVVASGHKLGIGTTSPARQLEVYDDGTNGQAVLALTAQNTENSRIMFADTDDSNIGILDYNHSDNSMRFNVNNAERMRIDAGGNLLVGTTTNGTTADGTVIRASAEVLMTRSNAAPLLVNRDGSDGTAIEIRNSNVNVGTISVSGSSTSYNTSSDYRLKEAVVDMTGAITRVKSLQPKRFNFIADDTVTVDGFMAHEAQTVVPEAVTGTHDEVDADGNPVMQGIDQSKLVPLLTAALKESIAKIEALETENTTQATQIADLITRVTALENA